MIQSLTINFHGICVHFENIIPGVPHRVVLPNAMKVNFGRVQLNQGDPSYYYTLPHYAFLRPAPDPTIEQPGTPLFGAYVRVLNQVPDQFMTSVETATPTPSLSAYLGERVPFSQDVVLAGNGALCYFDLFGGVVKGMQTNLGANYTSIEIQTDGPPRVLIAPFPHLASAGEVNILEFDMPTLTVANVDFDAANEDTQFDFLLNYLVARGGIPQVFTSCVPGLCVPGNPNQLPASMTGTQLQTALIGLGNEIVTSNRNLFPIEAMARFSPDVLTASCSDSNYP